MNIKDVIKDNIEINKTDDGVFSILSRSFKQELEKFISRYAAVRKEQLLHSIPYSEYPFLPFSSSATGEQWQFRRASYRVMKQLLKYEQPKKIIEIGAWNGWLTHHLVSWGHDVVSCDIFLDEMNGLSSKKYYKEQWLAIQADTSMLNFFETKFDVIIVNHCLAYMQDPVEFTRNLFPLLSEKGKIILLGLTIFKNPVPKAREVEKFRRHYKEKFKFDIFLRPTKGYLSLTDKFQLGHIGFKWTKYSDFPFRNLLSKIYSTKPEYLYGVYTSDY